ncbi:lysozyme [Altererythrobacter sp. MF3-039]|uniref:lysozyme n=1 Tax=Altererythrobacter sp. MF3-039 TaxID=3252901 RepID=UPI00390CCBD2
MHTDTNRKPLFDTVRDLLGRGLRQSEVVRIDHALDAMNIGPMDSAPCAPSSRSSRKITPAGIALIKRFEGCARKRHDGLVEAYPDPGSSDGTPWTIGWGATGPDIGPGTVWTQEQCDERLERDLELHAADVSAALGDAPTTQAQFDALVSFHYNTGAIARATLTKLHRRGDHAEAAREFARWIYNDGKVLKGLVKRRKAEAALYG